MNEQNTITIYAALSKVVGEIKDPERNKEGQAGRGKFKYADLSSVLNVVRPILAKHDLALLQLTRVNDGKVTLITRIAHGATGDFVESEYPVSDVTAQHQTMGASMTYARRYALSSILGISSVDDTDKDGTEGAHGAVNMVRMSSSKAKQILKFEEMIEAIDTATHQVLDNLENFYKHDAGWLPGAWQSKFLERIEQRREELQKIDDEATEEGLSANASLDRQFKEKLGD